LAGEKYVMELGKKKKAAWTKKKLAKKSCEEKG